MKPINVNSFQQTLAALGMTRIPNVAADLDVANQIAIQGLILQKIMIAALDVGIDWDTYRVWIEPGDRSTEICNVQAGDIVVLKLLNYDVDNARTIFYGQSPGVTPGENTGLDFPLTQVVAGVSDAWDFNDGAPVTAFVTAGNYFTGASLAAELQTQMNAVGANTYQVTWIDGIKKFRIKAVNAVPAPYTILPATGPNTLTSVGPLIGWTTDAAAAIAPWETFSNRILVKAIKAGDHYDAAHPLIAGEDGLVVLEQSLYGILDRGYEYRVPLSVRRSRIVIRNRV